MRLKQLLGIILPAMAFSLMAAGSVPELAGVRVEPGAGASVITILASGAFTHSEYRPADNLMLVDLAGVSVGQMDAGLHTVSAPGVLSYQLLAYKSAGGEDVARVELHLVPAAVAKVADVNGGVEVRVTAPGAKQAAAPVPVSTHTSRISNISVARSSDGLDIEIQGTGPMTAKTMKLAGPERLVVDIPNSVLAGRMREIPVNTDDVKGVRAARYQSEPPTTRIVVDMAAMHEFEVVPSASGLTVKLKSATARHVAPEPVQPQVHAVVASNQAVAAPAPTAQAKDNQQAAPAISAPENAPAQKAEDLAIVHPVFVPKKKSSEDLKSEGIETSSQSRADEAAAHFAEPVSGSPAVNRPPYGTSATLAANPALVNAALAQQQAQAPASAMASSTGCTGSRFTGEPISVNLKDIDLKDFFRVITEISGLNVVLDPAVKGSLTIVLNDVPWDQALAIVLNNNGLACQLQGNVLRIATRETLRTEAEARKAQLDAEALAIPKQTYERYLSYGHAKDIAPLIKKFLSPRGDVVADERSNALIIEDIPTTMPKIDSLLPLLDRKTPEVEIEARVVAASRNFARDIGTQMGFGFASGNNAIGGNPVSGFDSPIKLTPPPPTPLIQGLTAGTIPLFNNNPASGTSGLSFINNTTNFRLDFVLSMAENRGLAKVLSRPRVVTQNNIEAVIRQGQRIPVVTAAQLGGPPTVTYVDAFLRLTVTPQITAENTIFLKIDVENTTADFSNVNGAQLNPTLDTAQSTTEVLVTDGGTVVIGGVMATTNSVAISQVPVLGSIPMLGNLFKHTLVKTTTNELIFFITPKIIQT